MVYRRRSAYQSRYTITDEQPEKKAHHLPAGGGGGGDVTKGLSRSQSSGSRHVEERPTADENFELIMLVGIAAVGR